MGEGGGCAVVHLIVMQDPCLSPLVHPHRLPFEERARLAQNVAGKKLFELMARKRSNLAVAADVDTVQEMLRIAEAAGPHIAVFKTHVDIFDEWNSDIAAQLQKVAEQHGRHLACSASGWYFITLLRRLSEGMSIWGAMLTCSCISTDNACCLR